MREKTKLKNLHKRLLEGIHAIENIEPIGLAEFKDKKELLTTLDQTQALIQDYLSGSHLLNKGQEIALIEEVEKMLNIIKNSIATYMEQKDSTEE